MRREMLVVFALLASVLVATTPVAGSHQLAVASIHTTDTDFSGATLTNLEVTGSGDGASVITTNTIDDFEDGDVSEWTGDIVINQTPASGSFNGLLDAEGAASAQFGQLDIFDITTSNVNVTFELRTNDFDSTSGIRFEDDSGNRVVEVGTRGGGSFYYHDGTVNSFGTATANTYHTITLSDINFTAHTYDIVIDGARARDDVSFDTASDHFDSIDLFAGSGTQTYIDDISRETNATPATYIGANHSATNTEQGFVDLDTVTNATVTVTWETSNGGAWHTLNQTSGITTPANHTFTWAVESNSTVRVNVTVENETGNGEPSFALADEGVQFTARSPSVDNSSASPTGQLSTASPTFTIDVNDSDFPLAQGDSVTAELFVDGVSKGTDTLTANGTASVSATVSGGDHTYHWVVTDSYGHSATSQTFSISTPGELFIRRETNASQLVDDEQVNITAYHSGQVTRINTTDGTANLEDFPIDEPIIVRAEAEGYYTRTAVIEDIFDQQSMYMLNSSVATYQVRFDLQDPRGDFPRGDTVLFVERDIELNGSVEWRVIAGDNFGVQGVPVDLVQGERFRLTIKNLETGATASVGKYTAIQSETVTLSPAAPVFEFEDINRSYTWSAVENETAQKITVEYLDDANQTQEVKITIRERFNKSNVLVDNVTFTGSNSIVFDQPLTNAQVNDTWELVLYVDRGDGFLRFVEPIGSGPRDLIPAALDAVWRTSVGVFILLISSMAFSELNRGVGAVATALTGGLLWFIGLLSGVAIGPAVVASIGVSLAYSYRDRGR